MKKEKVYESDNIIIYSKKPEVGREADAASDCIHAATIFAAAFASHLKEPIYFLQDFRRDAIGRITTELFVKKE